MKTKLNNRRTRQVVSGLLAMMFVSALLAGCEGSSAGTETTEQANPESAQTTTPVTTQVAYELGSIKKGDFAHCLVCTAGGGQHGEELVAETIDYEGKTYAFCSESEKAQFISDPSKYIK